MNNIEHLEKLKQFQITEENESVLSSHEYLLAWIDNVAPLLKYDTQHHDTFIDSARTASTPGLSPRTITQFLNIAKSTVNQAIIELENDITEDKLKQQTTEEKVNNMEPKLKEAERKYLSKQLERATWFKKHLVKIIVGVVIGIIVGVIVVSVIIPHFSAETSKSYKDSILYEINLARNTLDYTLLKRQENVKAPPSFYFEYRSYVPKSFSDN